VLVDEDEGKVLAGNEALEELNDFLLGRLLGVNDEEVGANLLVAVANASEEETRAGVLKRERGNEAQGQTGRRKQEW